jgi:hypothetical protein
MMNKRKLFSKLFSVLLILGLLGGFATPVFAASGSRAVRIVTDITFFKPDNVDLAEPMILSGTLRDVYGHPIADKSIIFTIDDAYLGQTRSDNNGNFERKISQKMAAGVYVIQATFKGTSEYTGSNDFSEIKVLPADIKVQTVPPTPGITVKMDGREFTSGADGNATIQIFRVGTYSLEVLTDRYHNPSQRVEFWRWAEESYEPFRDVNVPTKEVIQVGLNIYHQVGQTFLDLNGNPVDPARIDEFMIRSAQGDVFVFSDGTSRWIPASRIARRVTGLEETKLLYSVISVTIDGSNVVNQSQQRFYTHPNETWPISLLLYSLHISAVDGMFGSPVGKSVNVEYPDGKIVNYPLNRAGAVDIQSLARGTYYIELVGANGMSNRLPVALSRNQQVNTKVITYLDMAVVAMLGMIVALSLLLYGRPWILHAILRMNLRTVWENASVQILKPADRRAHVFRGGYMSNKIAGLLPDESIPISITPFKVEEATKVVEWIEVIEAIPVEIPEIQMEPVETAVIETAPAKPKSRRRKKRT